MPVSGPHPSAKRYRLLAQLSLDLEGVEAWRAIDEPFGVEVVIYLSERTSCCSTEEGAAAMRSLAEPHPQIVQWQSTGPNVMVREALNGFSVLEMLRRRKSLSLSEAVTLLHGLPTLLDWADSRNSLPKDELSDALFIIFQPDISLLDQIETDVANWPRWQLKLSTMRIEDFFRQSRRVPPAPKSSAKRTGATLLAMLLRELIGNSVPLDRAVSRRPTGAFKSTRSADLLLNTLTGGTWGSATAFWKAFVTSLCEDQQISAIFPSSTQPVELRSADLVGPSTRMARFISRRRGEKSFTLCAASSFRFGRSRESAEFVVGAPFTGANGGPLAAIGRSHARLEIRDNQVCLFDGSRRAPSQNGSSWEDQLISPGQPVPLCGRGVLTLAGYYSIALLPMLGACAEQVILDGQPLGVETMKPAGAVISTSLPQAPMNPWMVWLLTTVGFHLNTSGDLEWHLGGLIPPTGLFLRAKGNFWIANVRLPESSIKVGQTNVAVGQAMPIRHLDSIRIGYRRFDVEIST